MKTRDALILGGVLGGGFLLSRLLSKAPMLDLTGDGVVARIASAWAQASPGMFKTVIHREAVPFADVILRVAAEQGVNPFLIEAIGWRESRWGKVLAADMTGDGGHGRGYMQIDDRTWGSWLASVDWRDPYTNISKGVAIYKSNVAYFAAPPGGAVELNAKQAAARGIDFAAAGGDNNTNITYPDPRPLAGDALIAAALAAYNTGMRNVLMSLACGAAADTTTTGGDYGQDVMATASQAAGSITQEA